MKPEPAVNDESWKLHPAAIFGLIFLALVLLHSALLQLPYFWDEAGYYIPAARDLLLNGWLIPHSTPSNAHPPLVMVYLAMCWKIAGFSPIITRIAMLAVAAFSLTGLFQLALRIANAEVAFASVIVTALYPVFFTQSSLAQVDLAAAGFTFWALLAYVENRWTKLALWFSLAVFSKETAVLAPVSLLIWELIKLLHAHRSRAGNEKTSHNLVHKISALVVPIVMLGLWYAYHYHRTGFVFGNPEFFRYNVRGTLHPLRIVLALLMRLWQATGYLGLYLLTVSAMFAMWLPPLPVAKKEKGIQNEIRPRIDTSVQFAFLAIVAGYVIALSVIGGAVLARYMLPAIPLIVIVSVSTLRRRVRMWRAVIAIVAAGFVLALFVNPPYGFSLEDNLAYRDYIRLHQGAEQFLELHYPNAVVLTAWPASDELTRGYLGYVRRPVRVFRVENFTVEELMSAKDVRSNFDVALIFSTKYEPPHSPFDQWGTWQEWKTRFFGYHRDVPPASAAEILGGQLVYANRRYGQWVGVIEMAQAVEARVTH